MKADSRTDRPYIRQHS